MRSLSAEKKIILLGFLCIIPFFILYVLPVLMTVGYSVIDNSISMNFIGSKNYVHVLENPYFQLGVKNLLSISLTTVCMTMVLSISICFLVLNSQATHRWPFFLMCLPFFSPSVSITAIWLKMTGVNMFSTDLEQRMAIIFLFTWKCTGVSVFAIIAALRNIPNEYSETAELDGASPAVIFFQILLPMCRKPVSVVLVILLSYAFHTYREVYLLFGEYPTDGVYLLQHFLTGQYLKLRYPVVAAGSTVFVGICGILYSLAGITIRFIGEQVR